MDASEVSHLSPLNPIEFISAFDQAAHDAGFIRENFGEIQSFALNAYRRADPSRSPRVYLSAGIHGDEPAPPWALLNLMREGFFDTRCTWFLCPMLNPTGFAARTRENHAKVDLNRDYKSPQSTEAAQHITWLRQQPQFDLVICLHEDWESTGFYLYELNPDQRSTLANAMIRAARTLMPIEAATIIDGREIDEPGIIRPIADPLLRETWPEAIYLRNFHSTLNYTIETPSALPLDLRIATQCAVLRQALAVFLQ